MYMFVEVSNILWNECYYYVVLFEKKVNFKKVFFVLFFMNLDMNYYWYIRMNFDNIMIYIENKKDDIFLFDVMLCL